VRGISSKREASRNVRKEYKGRSEWRSFMQNGVYRKVRKRETQRGKEGWFQAKVFHATGTKIGIRCSFVSFVSLCETKKGFKKKLIPAMRRFAAL
jgi:hypothetical protein